MHPGGRRFESDRLHKNSKVRTASWPAGATWLSQLVEWFVQRGIHHAPLLDGDALEERPVESASYLLARPLVRLLHSIEELHRKLDAQRLLAKVGGGRLELRLHFEGVLPNPLLLPFEHRRVDGIGVVGRHHLVPFTGELLETFRQPLDLGGSALFPVRDFELEPDADVRFQVECSVFTHR